MLIDSHCHLHHERILHRLESIILSAREQNVQYMLNVSTCLSDLALMKKNIRDEKIYFSAGSHPCHYDSITQIKKNLPQIICKQVIAIGESGIDKYRNPNESQQYEKFDCHLYIAKENKIPIIIHSRNAEKETVHHISKTSCSGVLHCFTGSKEFAEKLLDKGMYISFSGVITFKNSHLEDIINYVPLDRILIETDSPYLSPEPHRGKNNEPSFLIEIAKKICDIKGLSFKYFTNKINNNFFTLFDKVDKK